MTGGLYMDVHVPRSITIGLRRSGVDVLTAQEDHTDRWADAELLERCGRLGRMMFTQDEDFLVEATRRQRVGESFATVIFARQQMVPLSLLIEHLELLASAATEADFTGQVIFLPLK